MTVGTVFLMWIGEQIDEYGIGNGISLIIMAGIIARMPDATHQPALRARPPEAIGAATGRQRRRRRHQPRKDPRPDAAVRRRGRRRHRHHQGRSGASRRSRPSTSAAGASTAAPGSSCRCASTRPASCRSSSPAASLILPIFVFKWLSQTFGWSWASGVTSAIRTAGLSLQRLLHRADLLLLLLLDGDHLQPEGHGQQPQGLRQLHPRLPPRQAHRRLPGDR